MHRFPCGNRVVKIYYARINSHCNSLNYHFKYKLINLVNNWLFVLMNYVYSIKLSAITTFSWYYINFQLPKCCRSRRMQDVVYIKACFLLQNPYIYLQPRTTAIAIIVIQTRVIDTGNHVLAHAAEQKLRLGAGSCISSARCNSHFLGETTSSFWLTRDETPLHIIMTIFICSTRTSCSTGPQI